MMHATSHAVDRARERLGLDLTEAVAAQAIAAIIARVDHEPRADALLLRREDASAEVWIVRLGPVACRVVYNAKHAQIVTVLA